MKNFQNKRQRERRAEIRHRVFEAGVIKSSVAGIAMAQVLDTSPSGLRVTAPCPLPLDTKVEVQFEDARLSGSVRNCVRAQTTQFHLGIGNVTPTSSEEPKPWGIYAQLDRLTDVLR